jgi:hypothetical protein
VILEYAIYGNSDTDRVRSLVGLAAEASSEIARYRQLSQALIETNRALVEALGSSLEALKVEGRE